MSLEEGVGQLIPKTPKSENKSRRYKSKYPPDIYPTASTFNNRTTSRLIGNISGNFYVRTKPHNHIQGHATFGTSKGYELDRQPKAAKDFISKMQSAIKKLKPREKVPRHHERPLKKLEPNKDFIKLNADKNAFKRGKSLPVEKFFVQKKDYGTIPKYLDKIKEDIEKKFNHAQELKMKEEEEKRKDRYSLKNEEIVKIKAGLKQRWELLNVEYLKIAHIKKPDTQVMKKKKLDLEQQMKQIEDDLKKLSQNKLFIVNAKT